MTKKLKSKNQQSNDRDPLLHQPRATSNQKPFAHGGNVHAFARMTGVTAGEVIDFSASINPLGMPHGACLAYRQALANVIHYPEPYAESLVQALARYHGLDPSEILVGNGSTQLIHLCARMLAARRVLLVAPLFSEHESAFRASGAAIDYFFLRPPSFTLMHEQLMRMLTKGSYDALVMTNPNSPTGALIERTQVEELARLCWKTETYLLMDETFIDWQEEESVKRSAVRTPWIILFRSLTKFFALPGLRVGYLIAHPALVKRVRAQLEPWSVNVVAQEVGKSCLQDQEFIGRSRAFLQRERRWMFEQMQTVSDLRVFPSQANFFLVRILRQGMTAENLAHELAQNNLLIRVCANFVGLGGRFFRIAVRKRAENLRLLNTVRGILR